MTCRGLEYYSSKRRGKANIPLRLKGIIVASALLSLPIGSNAATINGFAVEYVRGVALEWTPNALGGGALIATGNLVGAGDGYYFASGNNPFAYSSDVYEGAHFQLRASTSEKVTETDRVGLYNDAWDQRGLTGSFSLTSTDGINIISGIFSQAELVLTNSPFEGARFLFSRFESPSSGGNLSSRFFSDIFSIPNTYENDIYAGLSHLSLANGYDPNAGLPAFSASTQIDFTEAVPEPSMWTFMALGIGMFGAYSRFIKRQLKQA